MKDFFKPDIPSDTIYHVGISGGKDSGAVLLWLVHESGIPRHQINASFCDTGWENEATYEQVRMLSDCVHPIEILKPKLDFFELAKNKRRFPSPQARFCTQHLKIVPTREHIDYLLQAYPFVVSVSGLRNSESIERASALEWDLPGMLPAWQWRPIIKWSIQDVFTIHAKYGIPMNPLYAAGADRVGCDPCIFVKKQQLRRVASNNPSRIDQIREKEIEIGSSFFPPSKTPARFHSKSCVTKDGRTVTYPTIDDAVRWSMTGKRARGNCEDDASEPVNCSSGFCE